MKLIVCEKCEAEWKMLHNMSEHYYIVKYCTFCGEEFSDDMEDEVELIVYEQEDY